MSSEKSFLLFLIRAYHEQSSWSQKRDEYARLPLLYPAGGTVAFSGSLGEIFHLFSGYLLGEITPYQFFDARFIFYMDHFQLLVKVW
jgi:hypothetical protein